MRETYGHLAADEFGPVRFENYRQSLVDRNLSRLVVKRKANYVLKMFQRGVKLELIPVEIWQRLLAVGPLEARCKPAKKVLPVSDAVIEATQAELTPVLRDLVEVHRLIGARPSEVCIMRPLPHPTHAGVTTRLNNIKARQLILASLSFLPHVSPIIVAPTPRDQHATWHSPDAHRASKKA